MAKPSTRFLAAAGILLLILAVLFFSFRDRIPPTPPPEDDAALPVEEDPTAPEEAALFAPVPATLHGANRSLVPSPMAGRVSGYRTSVGQLVEHDAVIAHLASSEHPDTAQAESRVSVARHQVRTIGHLVAEGYEPQANLDRAQEKLEAALAQLAEAQQAAEPFEIRSPVAGRVLQLLREEGEPIAEGDELLHILVDDELLATSDVPAQNAAVLVVGETLSVYLPNGIFEGRIKRIGSAREDGTVRIEISLPYREGMPLDGAAAEIVLAEK